MYLARILNKYHDEVIADLAEYYNIYDYKSHPLSRVAIFVSQLRPDSRVVMKMLKIKEPIETLLLAKILDVEALNLWAKTKDAKRNQNKPKSVFEIFIEKEEDSKDETMIFNSSKEFKKQWKKLAMKGG